MNHLYRLVWSERTGRFVAAPETASARGKCGGTRTLKPLVALFSVLGLSTAQATPPSPSQLPDGGRVVAGQATIAQSGTRMDITQTTNRAIIDWNKFDIGSQAHVNFAQPSASSVTLNRVLAGDASQIMGQLTANGQVWLINPAGVIFGAGSRVDVGGIVASSMSISNDDFMAGRAILQRNGASGRVENHGQIKANLVALLAPEVINEGIISARMGQVVLAAGERITLDAGAYGHLKVAVDPATVSTLVDNRHLVQADGGEVLMSAQAADVLLSAVVANSGTVQAQTLENRAGKILLLASMAHGEIQQNGLLDASAPITGDGGFVETSAAKVSIDPAARVTTRATYGNTGTWLIDPNDYTIAASGGDITGALLGNQLHDNNIVIQSANGAASGNGDIFVNDTVNWSANKLTLSAQRNIYLNRSLNGSGTASLALEYGQSAVAAGNTADYYVNAPVNLPAGQNFSTKLGSDGVTDTYTVITSLGVEGDTSTATLQGAANNPSGKYVLGADIDASPTSTWNNATGFVPIGGFNNSFSGNFNGLGHIVSGLTINRPNSDWQGMFGQASGIISNVGVVNANITGRYYVGGLVGGLVSGLVKTSYTTGNINGNAAVGGLIGTIGNYVTVSDSYSMASVHGVNNVGGLAGGLANWSVLTNSYATGAVTGSGNNIGGLLGYSAGAQWGAVTSNSFWDAQNSAQMKQQATYSGWDFANTWRIYEGQSTPILRAFQRDLIVTANDASKFYDGQTYSGGNGVSYSTNGSPTTGSASYSGTSQGATNAGSYAITPSGLTMNRASQQDYQNWSGTISYANGTLTINPAQLTLLAVGADNKSKTYGDTDPVLTYQLTSGNLVNGDSLTGSLTRDAGENVGNYAIRQGSLTAGSNYSINFTNGTLTINRAPLMIVASNDAMHPDYFLYSGLYAPGAGYSGGNGVRYMGFVRNDTPSSLNGTLGYGGTSQGAYQIGRYTITPMGLTSGNYEITYVSGTLDISSTVSAAQAQLQLKYQDALSRAGFGLHVLPDGAVGHNPTASEDTLKALYRGADFIVGTIGGDNFRQIGDISKGDGVVITDGMANFIRNNMLHTQADQMHRAIDELVSIQHESEKTGTPLLNEYDFKRFEEKAEAEWGAFVSAQLKNNPDMSTHEISDQYNYIYREIRVIHWMQEILHINPYEGGNGDTSTAVRG